MFTTSLWLAAALLGPPQQQAEPIEVSVRVDVSALPDESLTSYIADNLRQRQTQLLEDGGASVVDGAKSAIVVTVSRYGDGDVHYRFTVALLEDGSAAPVVERTGTCELCSEGELFAKVGDEVARVSGRLLYAPPEPEPKPDEGPGPADTSQEPEPVSQEPEQQPRVRRVGGAGWAGIGLAVAGVGVAVPGVVALGRPEDRGIRPGDDPTTRIVGTSKPKAGALLGVGLGAVTVGVVLIVVDQTIFLDRRRSRAKRSSSISPILGPSAIGLTWQGRF